jgi:hypothetical protein
VPRSCRTDAPTTAEERRLPTRPIPDPVKIHGAAEYLAPPGEEWPLNGRRPRLPTARPSVATTFGTASVSQHTAVCVFVVSMSGCVWRGWIEGSLDGVIDHQDWLDARVDDAVTRILQQLPRAL